LCEKRVEDTERRIPVHYPVFIVSNPFPARVLTFTAVVLGTAGVALLFAPVETSAYLTGASTSEASGQLISAGFLSLAVVNWMGRGAVYGGIYGRPILLGNFLFGFILGTTTLRAAIDTGGVVWFFAVYGALHTVAFAWLLFGRGPGTDASPRRRKQRN